MQAVRRYTRTLPSTYCGPQLNWCTRRARYRWLTGPYCRLCNISDGSRYFNPDESDCLVCDSDASGKIVTLVCVSLAAALIVCLFLRFRPDRKIKCVVRLYLRLASLYTQISLRAKCARTRHEPRGRPYVLSRRCSEPAACLASQVQAVRGLLPGDQQNLLSLPKPALLGGPHTTQY